MPASIQDIYLQFHPHQSLDADDPRYVDCMPERGLPALFQYLSLPLIDADHPGPVLFSGHVGDGKTTLLKRLKGQLERDQNYFVAFGEADQRLDLDDVEYEDVLMAILAVVDTALRQAFRTDMEAPIFQQKWEELAQVAQLPKELSSVQLALGPFAKVTTTMKEAPDARLRIRQRLRSAQSPTFLEVINQYLERAQAVVEQRGFQQLVVILDNLDRIPEKRDQANVYLDERLFVENVSQLRSVACHVIYTIRLGLVYMQGPNLMNRYGRDPIIVPMIPVRHPDGSPHEGGMARLRQIIISRLSAARSNLQETFEHETLVDRLCRMSGGHLRELMTFVQSACSEALATHPELPLTAADAERALSRLGALRRRVAMDYTEELQHVAQTHSLDKLSPETRQALINQRLVFEYFMDGAYWYDLCPLLWDEDNTHGASGPT